MHAALTCSQANTRNTTNSTRGYHVETAQPSATRQLTEMTHAGRLNTMNDAAPHPDLEEGTARGRGVVNVQADWTGHYILNRNKTDEHVKTTRSREVSATRVTPQIDVAGTENLQPLMGRTGLKRDPNAILPPENLRVSRKRTGVQPYAERGSEKTSTSI